ncbi:peroxisomal membrane protein 11-4-like [Neltuma alba]|uniref:peroxisomal membrane protein 11-4-like n=1 Tax=Neltuma alba TaxID=207710 RepID=UPI0010A43E15|nr:peroxisomal membrane protein 11-4-like [Prosopis alba]
MNDTVDKLVVFLAKRDGIDKLVKTFQYVSKLSNWRIEETNPDMAKRFKNWEVSSGLSRKAFRTGRFLTGFNLLRRNPGSNLTLRLLAIPANAGEMIYFFFDHFTWLARIGTINSDLAKKASFISAFGEAVGYLFFLIADFLLIKEGIKKERKIRRSRREISKEEDEDEEQEKRDKDEVKKIRVDRVMRLMAVAANIADLIIALAEIEPNPFCNHAVTLGISGLVSAWAGWYRNWPS